ncbi:MAG: peptide chain release factor N(5)-glutamine methyltransferase [Thermodesulfovibrionales bacterium]|nr:peptide chain release factor N(5)-glutamine methyltransferase [Thermodesulfovibrionales bacterium]
MNALDKLKDISNQLKKEGIIDYIKEAELIITEILKISKAELYTHEIILSEKNLKLIDEIVCRRSKGEPIQYILGYVTFFGLKIKVGSGVLIPRQETELLVEEAIKELTIIKNNLDPVGKSLSIIDLCTGSGCIALALAKHFPTAQVYGVDFSHKALQYATSNAKENLIENIHFINADISNSLECLSLIGKTYCIISNPPYIKRSDIKSLQREIKDYEPLEALNGGEDGLTFYKVIFKDSPKYLKENGLLILEFGADQASAISELASKANFKNYKIIKDYSEIERIFIGYKTL